MLDFESQPGTGAAVSFNSEPDRRENATHVMKFGGTSVADAARIRHVAGIVEKEMEAGPVGVVVSAVAKMTKLLVSAVEHAENGRDFKPDIHDFEGTHLNIVRELFADHAQQEREMKSLIGERCDQIHPWLKFLGHHKGPYRDMYYARVVGTGEILSSRIVHAFLRTQGIEATYLDAQKLIRTTDSLKDGKPDMGATQRHFDELKPSSCYLMPGFLASDEQGHMSLLGMDGSDCSAAIMARALSARICTLFKHDVDGIYTGNPHVDKTAVLIPRMSFAQAHDMAMHGATVVHPRAMDVLQATGINIRVCNTDRPDESGSVITNKLKV